MSSWPRVPISELCELAVDCVNKTAPVVEWPTPYKMIRTTNVRSGWVDTTSVKYVTADTFATWTRRGAPRPGDVLLTREAPLGEVGLLRSADNVFLGQRIFMYRTDPSLLDNRYLAYALQGPELQGIIRALGSGATVPHMRVPDCESLPIPTPALSVQRAIADTLGAFDDLIENNRRRIEVLEEMARLTYREWFVQFRFPGHEDVELVDSDLGPIPDGWPVTALAEHVSLERKSVKPAEYPDEAFDHYSIPAFDADRLPRAEPGNDIKSSKYLIAGQRVLLSKLNPRFPRVWRVDASRSERRSICSTEFLVLVTDQDWPASFVYATVGDSEFGGRLAAMAGGTSTSHQRVKPGDVMSLPIVGPEASLVSRYYELADPMLRLADNLIRQNEVLREARDLLLPRLVSGELDVSELDLELAEVG